VAFGALKRIRRAISASTVSVAALVFALFVWWLRASSRINGGFPIVFKAVAVRIFRFKICLIL
jgi:hypothetical protein